MNTLLMIATIAVIMTVMYSIPQAVKVYLSNFPKAISGLSIVFMVFGSFSWALFGYYTDNEPVLVGHMFLFCFSIFILLLAYSKAGIHRMRITLFSALFLIIFGITLAFFPKEYFGYLGAIISSLTAIPQGFKMIRQREATGVSGLTYLFLAIASLCWMAYGHLTSQMILVVPNLILFPTATLVYINVIKYRATNFWYQQNNMKALSH